MSKLSLSCNVYAKPVPSLPQITQKVTPNLLVLILCLPLSQFLLFIIIQSCVVIVFFFITNNIKFYTKVPIKTLYRNRICYFAYFLIASLLKIGLYQTSFFFCPLFNIEKVRMFQIGIPILFNMPFHFRF